MKADAPRATTLASLELHLRARHPQLVRPSGSREYTGIGIGIGMVDVRRSQFKC